MSTFNAGVVSASPGLVDSLGGLPRLLPPGHALLAVRKVESDHGNFCEYLIEGPWLPLAVTGSRPADVTISFEQDLTSDGEITMTGWFNHAPDRPWSITGLPGFA